jgi:hypothetical protein
MRFDPGFVEVALARFNHRIAQGMLIPRVIQQATLSSYQVGQVAQSRGNDRTPKRKCQDSGSRCQYVLEWQYDGVCGTKIVLKVLVRNEVRLEADKSRIPSDKFVDL